MLRRLLANQIFKNFSFLAFFELINNAFPLLITPYIIKCIGFENYGKVSFLQALILLLCVVTDWGFNITAIRDISAFKGNQEKLNSTISEIFWSKVYLVIGMLLIFTIILFFTESTFFYLFSSLLLLGKTFYPNWLFMGIEKNQYLVFGAIISNLIYGLLIFSMVKVSADFEYIIFYQGLSFLFISFFLYRTAVKQFNIIITKPKWQTIIGQLKSNLNIFYSNASLTGSAYSSTIILNFFISEYALGVYALAQKLGSISKLGLTIFSSAIYPRISNAYQTQNTEKLSSLFRKIYMPYSIIFISGTLVCLFFVKSILLYFDPNSNDEHVLFASILFIVPLITLFNIFPYLLLLSSRNDIIYSTIMIQSAVLTILLLIFLVPIWNIYGAVLTAIIVEVYIVIFLFIGAKQKMLLNFIFKK